MNFYEHQDRAERRTKYIIFLFIVAVICIVTLVCIPVGFATDWNFGAVIGVVVVCLLVVGISSLIKLSQLRGGGEGVALMLGGIALQRNGSDRSERRVQNIVEEMAIASGMPVPPVYVIEDDGINAFAAGWSADDAVIGVTRGCVELLNRDELQGVIAHEFSHISHGDVRINIRLIGVIFGIMALGITGWMLVRYVGPAIVRSSARSRSKEGAGGAGIGLGIIVFGLFLVLCGAIGTFFGRLIQAAVSRQREFLADASAVQFTRNPLGIGGALRKIGGFTPLKHITSDVGQCNHLFFSQAMGAIFASHPPISERISRVEGASVENISVGIDTTPTPTQTKYVASGSRGVSSFSSSSVRESILHKTDIQEVRIDQAKKAIRKINPILLRALHSGWSARIVMYALLSNNHSSWNKIIAQSLTVEEFIEYKKLSKIVGICDPIDRLPIIDLAAPALRSLSKQQLVLFHSTLNALIKSDGVVTHFEWSLVSVIQKHTSHAFGAPNIKTSRVHLSFYKKEIILVLQTLARCGKIGDEEENSAFVSGLKHLNIVPTGVCTSLGTINQLNTALKKLRALRFVDKGLFIESCEICVTHDGVISVVEAETLRAIGDILDCPIPLFL